MKFVDINSLSRFLTNLKNIFEPKGSLDAAKVYTDDSLANLTADDIGVYVQSEEPTDAAVGDIWVDVDADSHLDPEIVIDSTLTQYGQAADAKVVGEELNNKVDVAKEINPNWEKWNDVRYNYGFDKNKQPIFNTINGTLESDTMISVRGGKGRWNKTDNPSSEFVSGGHVFEGWSGNDLCRLTMLMGKFHETFGCIQTYSPAGLYEDNRRFGWLKLGSDDKRLGTDFSTQWTTCYTPITLNPQTTPTEVPNWDLNPQLTSKDVPIGTMFYDAQTQRIKVYTQGGWKAVGFTNDLAVSIKKPITSYRNGMIVAVESGKVISSIGRIAYFPLNKYKDYTVIRSQKSARYRIYLYSNNNLEDIITNGERGYLVTQDTSHTALDTLTFNSADYNFAVVMLSNATNGDGTTIRVDTDTGIIEPIANYRDGYMVSVESGIVVNDGRYGRIAYFPLNKYTEYEVNRSETTPRYKVYLYFSEDIDSAITSNERGYLVTQDENHTTLDTLTFNSADYNLAVVMLSNTTGSENAQITIDMKNNGCGCNCIT